MAGDDTEEKTFQPSGRRLQQLRRQGQIAKSQDFVGAVSLAILIAYLMFMYGELKDGFAAALLMAPLEDGTSFIDRALRTAGGIGMLLARLIGPVFAVAAAAYIAAVAFDSRGLPIKGLTLNFTSLNPVTGVKNLFKLEALVELAKGLFKIGLMAACIWELVKLRANDLFWSPTCGAVCAYPLALRVLVEAILICLIIYLLIGLLDIKISRALFNKENKMTLTEVKRESKEDMGDPNVRRQRRQIMRESATTPVIRGMGRATMILLGEDDDVVAIAYIQGVTPAPVIAARGSGVEGRALLAEARNRSIPAIRKPELVAALMKRGGVGRSIPNETFREVATAMVQSGSV